MNNYSVYDISGSQVATIQASDSDEALSKAISIYGLGISVTRQYTTNAIGIDPLWILLGLLVLSRLVKKKS